MGVINLFSTRCDLDLDVLSVFAGFGSHPIFTIDILFNLQTMSE